MIRVLAAASMGVLYWLLFLMRGFALFMFAIVLWAIVQVCSGGEVHRLEDVYIWAGLVTSAIVALPFAANAGVRVFRTYTGE